MPELNPARHDVSHLANMELLTPEPEGTVWFFTELLGMTVTHQEGQSVYLRAYEDPYRWSLKVTESRDTGMQQTTFRADSPEALERRASSVAGSTLDWSWSDGDHGYGKTFTFRTPEGHNLAVVWDADRFVAPPEDASPILNRPSRRPLRGVPVKRIDHVNLAAAKVEDIRETAERHLGFVTREKIVAGGDEIGAWMSSNALHHQLACLRDTSGARGRYHHLAFYYGDAYSNLQAAEMFREYGVTIELGPDRHGLGQAFYLYVIEPGGNRIELFGDGLLVLEPDWETRVWNLSELFADTTYNAIGGSVFPNSYFTEMMPTNYAAGEAIASALN